MKTFFRVLVICVCGGVLVWSALRFRSDTGPLPAPAEVQEEGLRIIGEQMAIILKTEFGQSPRGRLLFERVEKIMDEKRIVFTAEILGGERALCKCDLVGGETWYIEVMVGENGKHVHRQPHELIEVAFHEALHSIKGGFGGTASIEEECDAFVAGHQAEAAVQGVEPQQVVILEDVPVAKFVARSYVGITHSPDYVPVVETFEWLKARSGL